MNMKMEDYEVARKQRSTAKQYLLGLIAYFSSVAPSMSLGFSAIALPPLQAVDNPYRLDDSRASWVASIASIATPIGCFLSGPISDRFGRKTILLVINVVTLVGWSTIALAFYIPEHQYGILLLGRLITGMSTGLASMPATVYMAEVSSPRLRGTFTTASAIFFGIGVLVVYVFGYFFQENWGTLAMVTAILPCAAFTLTILFLHESPTWLVSKDQVQSARVNMVKIFGQKEVTPFVDEEIDVLVHNREKSKLKASSSKSFLNSLKKKGRYMRKPTFWKPFALIMTFFFFQQFSGTFVVIFYAIHIVKQAGVTFDPYVAIIMVGSTRVLTAMLVSYISRTFGRRPMSIISGSGMTLCMLMLGGYIALIEKRVISESLADTLSFLPAVFLVAYFFASTLGFLTMPFAMNAEVFPTKVRGLGTGLTTCFAYIFNFMIIKAYPFMVEQMSYGVFTFYGGVSLLGTIFILTMLPETRGKTLQEIEELFDKKQQSNEENHLNGLSKP